MKKYTFIAEFREGTFISQHNAKDLTEALMIWVYNLDIGFFSKKNIERIIEEIKNPDSFPAPLNGIDNVWCTTFLTGKDFLLLNIVETV